MNHWKCGGLSYGHWGIWQSLRAFCWITQRQHAGWCCCGKSPSLHQFRRLANRTVEGAHLNGLNGLGSKWPSSMFLILFSFLFLKWSSVWYSPCWHSMLTLHCHVLITSPSRLNLYDSPLLARNLSSNTVHMWIKLEDFSGRQLYLLKLHVLNYLSEATG